MARTMAISVLALMGEDARPALPDVEALASGKLDGRTYDIRAAKGFVDDMNKN